MGDLNVFDLIALIFLVVFLGLLALAGYILFKQPDDGGGE